MEGGIPWRLPAGRGEQPQAARLHTRAALGMGEEIQGDKNKEMTHRHAIIRTMGKAAAMLLAACCTWCLTACIDEEQFPDSPQGNLEALWRIIDEHYCFLDYKKEAIGLDWDEVHARYASRVDEGMSRTQLFEVLCAMLSELRDGHVNIYTSFDTGREWSWSEDYPSNVSDTLLRKYLGTDYKMSNGLNYRVLDDNIGYVRYPSFANELGSGNLDDMLTFLAPCRGLIIDIRSNGGGMLTSAETFAARFTNEELLVGYIQHKTGKGHSDFSPMEKQILKPAKAVRWQKPVVVLTNRGVFSAANEFVKYMKCCPKVTIVGDRTGGGAGMPFSSQLPCGWSIRFSACPIYDRDKNSTEFGIEPDHHVGLTDADFHRGRDTIIEHARQLLGK
ncbi:MAG: S41 family peptidase [Prevotella sp.]|nr:S41 family peptidase [Prevotella sp.]